MRIALRRGAACVLLVWLVLCFSITALAAEQRVFDDAGLFGAGEAQELEAQIAQARETTGMDFVIVTTNDARGKTAMAYADDYYDENDFGTGSDMSGVLFLIDMDNRELYISTAGEMIRYLTDARVESLLDDVYVGASNNDFAASGRAFITGTVAYVDKGIVSDQYNYDTETGRVSQYRSISVSQILLFALISIVVGGCACLAVKAKYQMKFGRYTYPFQEKAALNITHQVDELTNKYVTTRHIPPPSSSSSSSGGGGGSRSSTHSSSSGRSHGGGGRKF